MYGVGSWESTRIPIHLAAALALLSTALLLTPYRLARLTTASVTQGSLFEHGHRLVLVNSVWRFELKARDRLDQR